MQKQTEVSFFDSLFPRKDPDHADRKFFWGMSTGVALVGIEDPREIIGALMCHTVAWYNGGIGPSVIYNFLTGIRVRRGQYRYTAMPIVSNIIDFDGMPPRTHAAHGLALIVGYFSSKYLIRPRNK